MSMVNPDPYEKGFVLGPKLRVTGIFDDGKALGAALNALAAAQFGKEKIQVFMGELGEKRIDFSGKEHGLYGKLLRTLQNFGDDSTALEEAQTALHAGKLLIGVLTDGSEAQKHAIYAILKTHQAHGMHYWDNGTIESLP